MYKSLSFAFLILLCFGCNDDNVDAKSSDDCGYLHYASLSLKPMSKSILVNYGFYNPADIPWDPSPSPQLSCEPQTIELMISRDGLNFENIATLEDISGTYLIENLEDCSFLTVRIEGSHSDFETVFATRTGLVGEVSSPQIMNNPLSMEDFTLASDGDQFIYRTTGDNWYLSSFSNPSQGQSIFEDVVKVRWNTSESNKIAGVENILVPILPNLNGSTSKNLVEYDLNTGIKEVLHEVEKPMDFDNEVYDPEQYWIHEFHYGLDGRGIYFMSNKENGGSSNFEQKVYDNIWKLDLATKEIEVITDFLPLGFDLVDFIEDPKQDGNFYISGGERGVEVVTDDNTYFVDRIDIHYYNSADQSITPIFISDEETEYLNIDPIGENLIYTTTISGKFELRSFHLSNKKHKQITVSDEYKPLKKWTHINWISSNQFITTVIRNGDQSFATFSID